MATAATSLLGLALPVTGELSGTWGDTVNVSITALLDTAVAGTTTLSSDADVTLTTTTLAANQARQAIILWTAGGTVTRTITVPAQSKSYIVINKTSSSQSIKIVGVGPTTGVTIVAGTAAFVVWDGADFVTASVTSTTGILPVANGGTGLASGTSGGVLAYTATGTLASSTALAASALVIGGGAGAAPSTTTTGTGVVTALGVNVGTAGAFVVNGGALGSPSSVGTMPAFTLGGTVSGGGNQINNVIIGTTTPLAGNFTTLSANSETISTQLTLGGVVASGVATGIALRTGSTKTAWLVGAQYTTNNAFEITPSTAAGGTTFTTPVVTVTPTGLAVAGTLSATGDVTLSAQILLDNNRYIGFKNTTGTYAASIFNDTSNFLNLYNSGNTGTIFYVNAAEKMRLTSSALALQSGISLTGGTSGTGYSFSGSAPATSLTLDSSGNLGIGVSGSPQSLLNTASTGQVQIGTASWPTNMIGKSNARTIIGNEGVLILWNDAAATAGNEAALYVGPKGSGTNGSTIIAGGYVKGISESSSTNNGALTFGTNSGGGVAERARIDSSGNVGIGTSLPTEKLSVNGPGMFTGQLANLNANSFSIDVQSSPLTARLTAVGADGSTNLPMIFAVCTTTTYTERMRIDTSGNLLVGTTTTVSAGPTSRVISYAGSASTAAISAQYGDSYTGQLYRADSLTTSGTGWSYFMGLSGNGTSITTTQIQILGNGNIQNTNNSYGAISDIKRKENITDATPKLEKLNQVRVVNFNMIGEEQKQLGVIAQELEQVFPSMIEETPDRDVEGNDLGTTTKSVKYSVFVPMLIKAIQEQQALITQLQADVLALKGA